MKNAERIKKQILIVEHEGPLAADVQRRLERLGYSVPAIAQSGEEALLCARSTPFDLVLISLRIQGHMDGIATAAALKAEFEMPVVYMTAHSDWETGDSNTIAQPFNSWNPAADGNLTSAVQIAIDSRDTEHRMRASQAWLLAILRSAGEAFIATDGTGAVILMNPAAEELTGWRAHDAQGRQLRDILVLVEGWEAASKPVHDLGTGQRRSCILISRAGERIDVEVERSENRAGGELLGAVIVMRDIRLRKELEGGLEKQQAMEAVACMAAGLAHEFNNQLMVILGYADELAAGLSGEQQEDALEIKRAAAMATSISSQLLALSRGDSGRAEVLNLHDVIREIQPMLAHTLGKTHCLKTELGATAGLVRADGNQLKQVLLNLTLNARDAMSTGGEVRIESRTVEIAADSPEGRLHPAGLYARIRFADSGSGMDPATLARIFEPYFTTKKAGRGSGLGLSIVHRTIASYGGSIRAASGPGIGTTFEILLPCVGTFSPICGVTGPRDAEPTILLVDDEDSVRKLIHDYLARAGFQILEAANSEEAELIAGAYPHSIQVLIADVMMPGLTGPELAERLAPRRAAMKALFVSGYRRDSLRELRDLGRDAQILAKPFTAAELLRRVHLLLGAAAPATQ